MSEREEDAPRFQAGTSVRCRLPGKRAFLATVIKWREAEAAVDVIDPKNGGLRTLSEQYVKQERRRRGR